VGQAETRTGKRAALWAAVALIAIAAAGMTGYKIVAERTMSGMIAERGGKVGDVEADFLGRIHLRDVNLPLEDGSEVHIAAIDGRPEIFFLKGMLQVAGLEFKTKLGSVEVPHATVEEANLGYGTMMEIFGGRGDLPLSKRIELFAASRVLAQEILVTQTVGKGEQKLVYRNVVSEGIANGRVSRFSAESASFEVGVDGNGGEAGGEKRLTGSLGSMTVQDIDAAYLARLYTEKAGQQDKEAKPVYGPSSVKDLVFSDGEARFGYAEIRSSGISMAMPPEPLLETLNELSAVSAPDQLPPAERQAYFTRILSIVDMMKKADMEMLGLKMEVPAKDGDKGKKIEFATDRLAFQLDGRMLDATLNGLSVAEGENYFKISEAALSGFSWSPTFESLEQMAALDAQQLENFPLTTLLPEFGTVRLAGIDADLPGSVENGAESPSAAERVRFSIREYEAALTKPRNGIPTDIRVSYQDLTLPIPANIEEKAFVELRRLGIDELVLSSNLEAAWDEAQQTLVIKEISTSGKDLAGFSFSGVMGGVSGDFFSGDEAKIRVALFGLTLREAKLEIEDKGLAAKGLKAYAEQNDMTEDQARGMLTMTSSVVLQQFADGEPRLQHVVDAVSKFIAKPGTFTLTVKSKSPSGLGALELAAASQNPLLLLDRVDIEAVAE